MSNGDTPRAVRGFGDLTLTFDKLKGLLPSDFYARLMDTVQNGRTIAPETADVVAHAMKDWAVGRGATHYTHWFQPLTGLTAEKHDAFLDLDESGQAIAKFSGRQLIVSEPDASSFPHGGLRSTFEARGYAAWDPTSPAFLIKREGAVILALPSVFVSYKGEVLDKKTPLLRSISVVGQAALRMLRLLGNDQVVGVSPTVGAEQEYFLVSEELYKRRADLCEVGITLFGAAPSRGQLLEDHYFGAISERVLAFMEEAEQELWQLGVPVRTRHNEVAPAQFELAVLHGPAHIAADQNQLVMEVLGRVAPRHKLRVLLHEKPYAHINGSGKHNNWSLVDSEGTNLFDPGRSPESRVRFLVFLLATVRGMRRHGPLLQAVTSGSGNDRRLGGHEAPPRVMSVYLGASLNSLLDNLAHLELTPETSLDTLNLGVGGVPVLPKDTTDRNRTSPMAFTGNKFELRALGSSTSIAVPNTVLNTMLAESLDEMSDQIEAKLSQGKEKDPAVLEVLREAIEDTRHLRYDGDCYTEAWLNESIARGLPSPSHTPAALEGLVSPCAIELFERYRILTTGEVQARYRVRLEQYTKTVSVELRVGRRMIDTQILPAALEHQKNLALSLRATEALLGSNYPPLESQRAQLEKCANGIDQLYKLSAKLAAAEAGLNEELDIKARAWNAAEVVRPLLDEARAVSDQLEPHLDAKLWPLPRYDELLRLS